MSGFVLFYVFRLFQVFHLMIWLDMHLCVSCPHTLAVIRLPVISIWKDPAGKHFLNAWLAANQLQGKSIVNLERGDN